MEVDGEESLNYLLDVYMPKAKDFIDIVKGMAFRDVSFTISYSNLFNFSTVG
jgi:hypothetical protein